MFQPCQYWLQSSWLQVPCSSKEVLGYQHVGVSSSPVCCSAAKSCATFCHPMDCRTPGSSVLHCLPKFAAIHAHWVWSSLSWNVLSKPQGRCLCSRLGSASWALISTRTSCLSALKMMPTHPITSLLTSNSPNLDWPTGTAAGAQMYRCKLPGSQSPG